MEKPADTSAPVHDLIARRWSPRAFDVDTKLDQGTVRSLLEAARWAPSYGNTQPARFLFGIRPDAAFDRILGTLTESNQGWARRSSALFVGLAAARNDKGEVPYAEFGVGLASANLVLQAVAEGLVAHQMAGFDAEAVRREFGLPDDVRPVIAIAVGGAAEPEVLGEERRVERERAPRDRIALSEFAHEGDWGNPAF
ncbi:nitroreductase [Amycolatopsis antarctica]|uniref:Nitroreductase n=1 Tax=Amycolatopsis antarctica TaxID=1854586 RepID=A0A263D5N2_9PSEU|nr:nitroreductase family protein [Amycolatopsis antarctica]OZM73348.1 nitroreductase [Amycolatopsis antarctica]